ncbi:hypothetical protein L6452_36562 [Arctium lappa]|uniref:Uncharacterized protein n=1 Tax=Arctium lappa TaxID=4217 RepID=A0ACB8YDR4_ARCLA|nr:hypothetical protein L6452_36562 [Arctium lappa]
MPGARVTRNCDNGTITCHSLLDCTAARCGSATLPRDIATGHSRPRSLCFGGFGLEDSSFVKEAQSGVKSRFSLNLASQSFIMPSWGLDFPQTWIELMFKRLKTWIGLMPIITKDLDIVDVQTAKDLDRVDAYSD